MGRSFYIITALVGFLAGVGMYLVWWPGWEVVLGLGGFFVLCFLFLRRGRLRRPRLYILFFVFLCLGLMRAGVSEHRVTSDQIDFYNGQKVELVGVITETDVRRDKAKYTVRVEGLIDGLIEGRIDGRIDGDVLITLNKYPQFNYGDRVKIVGELKEPGEFDGFDYGNYLSRYDIYSVMYYPKIEVLESGQGNMFWACMNWAQNRFMDAINRLFPEPHASFEAGLLIGARKGIPDDLMTKFNITGLTHIIAISGYNIAIIVVFFAWLFARLPRKAGFVITIAAIILFTLFVGASPSVVRASIMGILGLLALNYGRQGNIHLTILWTAFFMILWNPKILWWDAGFQLSFAAVLGLVYVAPLFKKYTEKLPQAFGVREAILMTLSAQVMALPIIIYNFGRLSLIAPIANLLVIFAIPPAMLFGFIAVILSFLFFPLGLVPAYVAWGILAYIIKVIELTAAVPYASIDVANVGVWMMFGYYMVLVLILYYFHQKDSEHRTQDSAGDSVDTKI
jgi:competence protein ComEC